MTRLRGRDGQLCWRVRSGHPHRTPTVRQAALQASHHQRALCVRDRPGPEAQTVREQPWGSRTRAPVAPARLDVARPQADVGVLEGERGALRGSGWTPRGGGKAGGAGAGDTGAWDRPRRAHGGLGATAAPDSAAADSARHGPCGCRSCEGRPRGHGTGRVPCPLVATPVPNTAPSPVPGRPAPGTATTGQAGRRSGGGDAHAAPLGMAAGELQHISSATAKRFAGGGSEGCTGGVGAGGPSRPHGLPVPGQVGSALSGKGHRSGIPGVTLHTFGCIKYFIISEIFITDFLNI